MFKRFTCIIIYVYVYICTHSLSEIVPLGMVMLPKRHRLSNKNSSVRHGKHPSELLEEFRAHPKHFRLLFAALGCLPGVESTITILLLRIPHTLDAGFWEIKLELTRELLLWGLALRVSENCQGREQPVALPYCKTCEPQQWPEKQEVPKGAIVEVISQG